MHPALYVCIIVYILGNIFCLPARTDGWKLFVSNNRWPAMMSICFSGNLPYYVIQFNLIYVYAYMANKVMMTMMMTNCVVLNTECLIPEIQIDGRGIRLVCSMG